MKRRQFLAGLAGVGAAVSGVVSGASGIGPAASDRDTASDLLASRFSVSEWAELDAANTELLADPHVGLRYFCEDAWTLVEPENPFIPNWHLDAVCDVLMAVTRGDLHDVIINMPPRLGKSLSVVVFWPCWEWGPAQRPQLRNLFFTYGHELTLRDARKRRIIMDSSWFRARWPHVVIGQGDWETNNAVRYENSKRGFHQSSSVGGMALGEGGDRIIADDPIKASDIYSDTIRGGVNTWWSNTVTTRRNTGRDRHTSRIIMMQRLHENDLSGHATSVSDHGYYHLVLPMEFDPKRLCVLPAAGAYPGFRDPRTEPGECLVPAELIPGPPMPLVPKLTKLKKEMIAESGTSGYESQFNQNPEPAGGGILKRAWWWYYVTPGHPLAGKKDENGHDILVLPRAFDLTRHFWDCAFKDTETSSYVVGQSWGVKGRYAYLRHMRRDRLDFMHTLWHIRDMRHFPLAGRPDGIYIEDKANGPALISVLRQSIPIIVPVSADASDGSKVARAHAAAPALEAGSFVLPHPSLPPGVIRNGEENDTALGVEAFLSETSKFPNSSHNDIVDTFTMAHNNLILQEDFDEDHFVSTDIGL